MAHSATIADEPGSDPKSLTIATPLTAAWASSSAIGLRDAVARAPALAIARREAPGLPGPDERQPVTGCRRPELVALVHRDEEVGGAGDVGEPDRRPDPARLDAEVAPVGEERHDGRGIRRGRRARIAGRRDAEHEPPARGLDEAVDLADAVGQRQDRAVARERRAIEPRVGIDPALGRDVQRVADPTASPSGVWRSAMTRVGAAPADGTR